MIRPTFDAYGHGDMVQTGTYALSLANTVIVGLPHLEGVDIGAITTCSMNPPWAIWRSGG